MRAVLGRELGDIDEMIYVSGEAPRPQFDPHNKKMKGMALVRVQACALAPGDTRVLSGLTREIQGPPAFPYIPGGDVCGVVEAIADGESYLKVGDCVVAQFHQNHGGLGEYAIVKASQSERKPSGLSPSQAAATASSGTSAVVVSREIKEGDRVLVIGGSGGVGTFLVQLAKLKGASFVAAVSTQTELMQQLGVDRAINYHEEDVWTLPEFQSPDGKFDIVIDLVEGGWDRIHTPACKANPIVKDGRNGGRFVTTVCPRGKTFELHSYWQAIKAFALPALMNSVKTWLFQSGQPRYKFLLALGVDKERSQFRELFQHIESGKVQVVLHEDKVYELNEDDVKEALHIQASGHAHGKLVVRIAD